MPSSDRIAPVPMRRVALVAPHPTLRALLVRVAAAGVVEVETPAAPDGLPGPATRALQRLGAGGVAAAVAEQVPDLHRLEESGRADLIAGEAALEHVTAGAVTSPTAAAVAGWMPADEVGALAERLAAVGGAVVPLPRPPGVQPPTLLRRRGRSHAVHRPGRDLRDRALRRRRPDAVRRAGLRADVRDDVRRRRPRRCCSCCSRSLARAGRPRVARPGCARAVAVRRRRRAAASSCLRRCCTASSSAPPASCPRSGSPRSRTRCGCSLAGARASVRCCSPAPTRSAPSTAGREGGWPLRRCYAPSGLAGAALFLGPRGGRGRAARRGPSWLVTVRGARRRRSALALSFVGLLPPRAAAWPAVAQATVELFDLVLRLGANLVSFARLAAFGLTHAALGAVVWEATVALWARGGAALLAAVAGLRARQRAGVRARGPRGRPSRRCAWSTTSCSPASSTARAGRSGPGTSPSTPDREAPRSTWVLALRGRRDVRSSHCPCSWSPRPGDGRALVRARPRAPPGAVVATGRGARAGGAAWSWRSRLAGRAGVRGRRSARRPQPQRRPSAAWAALIGRRDRRGRLLDRRSDRRRLHRRRGAGRDERAPGAVRPGDGDRRAGRGHRDLRADRRDHPDRQGVSAVDRRSSVDRRAEPGRGASPWPARTWCWPPRTPAAVRRGLARPCPRTWPSWSSRRPRSRGRSGRAHRGPAPRCRW